MTRHTPLFDELVTELGQPEGLTTEVPDDVRRAVLKDTGPLMVAAYLRQLAADRASISRAELVAIADGLDSGQG